MIPRGMYLSDSEMAFSLNRPQVSSRVHGKKLGKYSSKNVLSSLFMQTKFALDFLRFFGAAVERFTVPTFENRIILWSLSPGRRESE